jgi:hypothetical protein
LVIHRSVGIGVDASRESFVMLVVIVHWSLGFVPSSMSDQTVIFSHILSSGSDNCGSVLLVVKFGNVKIRRVVEGYF